MSESRCWPWQRFRFALMEHRQQMLDAIGALPPLRFAAVDGALFDDFAQAARAFGLEARALYREGADADTVDAGPFLVQLRDYVQAERLLELIGARPTGVFWSSPLGEDHLYRHLRKLNVVQIALVDFPQSASDFCRVLFRHADCNIVATMMAVMDSGQKMEFFGDAPAIAYSIGASHPVQFIRAEG